MISALCVDDEQELLPLYKLFLEQSGEIQVDTADSVKMAVGKLKKIRYDVIISDYSMPEYDGVAFLKCILPTYGDIPFILFTGKGCEDTVIEALNNGARFYVQKGEDPKEQFADLIHKIKQAVGLKELEDALRNSELRYRKLFETANDGIILLDADTGEIMNANPFLVHLIGSSLEEILGKHLWDIGIFRDGDLLKNTFLELRTKKNIRYDDLPLLTKNGQEIVVEFVSSVYTVDHADVIQCNIRDITGRKRVEEALQTKERQLSSIYNNLSEVMFFLSVESDLRFRFISVNQSFLDATGLSENQVAGKYVDEVIPEPSLTLVLENYKQAIQENKTVRWFEVTPYPSGTKYGHVAITPVYDRNGRCTNLIGSVHDITEIKQIEEALRVSKEKYTKVFLSAPDAITISELESGRFMEVNDAASKIWGYSRDELIGRSALELGIWPKKEIRDAFIDQVRTNGRVEQYEVMERRKSGDLFNASATANTITIGNIRYLIAITRDISDLKRAEEQLRHFNEELEKGIADRTEKLNASLEEREILLREVHHRVKNNLQIILSLIRLQSRNIKDPHLLDTMGDFQNRIMAMAHVHERMYRAEDFSRIDLSEIVTFLGTSLFKSYNVNPHHIRLNVEMKDLQISLNSAIPISLIINELISNSIKHAFPTGTQGEITIAGRREGDTLVLSFKDTGIGISKDIDWIRNDQSFGHQLVLGLVQQLNGTIELNRTTGTVFNIVVKEKQ